MFRSISRQYNASGLAAIALLLLALFVAWRGYWLTHEELNIEQVASDFYANSAAELGSIAITVLVIETLNARRATRREKADLILEMGSPDNTVAREALRKIRIRGWLEDGSFRRMRMWDANLRKADLRDANLQGADLEDVVLQGTNFINANLQGTVLSLANLEGALLIRANLRGARLWKANLQGADLRDAIFDEKTILPDDDRRGERSFWTPDTDMARFTDPKHPNFWRSNNPDSPAYRDNTEHIRRTVVRSVRPCT